MKPLCKCGCGEKIINKRHGRYCIYIRGHQFRVFLREHPNHLEKACLAAKATWNDPETRQRRVRRQRQIMNSPERKIFSRQSLIDAWKNRPNYMLRQIYKNSPRFNHKRWLYELSSGEKIYMMSGWEVRWARVMDFLGWKWYYNGKASKDVPPIFYFYRGKEHRYFPDFLVEHSQLDMVEVKGWMTEKDKAKFEAVKELGGKIFVVTGKILKKFEDMML